MIVLHEMRRRARFLVGPLLGLALTSYFVYHTIEGDRGLRAWRDINQQLHVASDQLATVAAERDALEHKVDGLNPNHVDPDLLDQQIRQQLDLVSPGEVILMQPSSSN
ncbi:MAG TPA: septum formation initiator family protein [Stellaceae bacterium]|nr:septum formation initiator family protein [Stellaceae bacterium]